MLVKINICKFILVLCFVSVIKGNVIVDTKSGKVAGKEVASILPNEKYYSFMGIPYAEPPIESLRFLAPKPHPGWSEVLDGTKEKKACAQFYLPGRRVPNYGFYGDEDCLHLSIHTPKPDDNHHAPVIVFIFNDHFRMSHNGSKDYGPDFFMAEDVVLVTVNHRLGSLGFLSFEDDLLPGNNGLRDVILALKWINENIERFGGDPTRITLFGHQGGAALVDVLLHSEKAKGLFSAAILDGDTAWNSMYFVGKTKEKSIRLSEILDRSTTISSLLVKRLSDIGADNLTKAELESINPDEARKIQRAVLPFSPVIEHLHPDAVLTQLPEENPQIDVSIMIGYNSRESLDFCERYLRKPQYLTFAERDFIIMVPVRLGFQFKLHDKIYEEFVKEIKKHYFVEGYVKISSPGEYLTYINDVMVIYPMDYALRQYANHSSSPVYYYTFDYSGELNINKKKILEEAINIDGTYGAAVGDNLCYMFVCKKIRKTYKKLLEDADSEEMKVLRNVVKMWTNFAKSRNPTPDGSEIIWKPATVENKEILVIGEELELKERLHDEKIKYWDDIFAKYKEKAVDGVIKDVKDEL